MENAMKALLDHHRQVGVKFVNVTNKPGKEGRLYQYAAIDDAISIRVLKICEKRTQANALRQCHVYVD